MSGEVPEVAQLQEATVRADPVDTDGAFDDESNPPAPPRRRRRWRRAFVRVEALLALIVVGGAVAFIVTSTLKHSPASAPATRSTLRITRHHVRAGDSLATMAVRYHSSVAILEQLNPDLNPQALHPGQVLRVGTLQPQ